MRKLLIIIPIILNTYLCAGQFLRNDTIIKEDTLISNQLKNIPIEKTINRFYITLENDTIEVDEIKDNRFSMYTEGLVIKTIRCYKDGVKAHLKPKEIKGFKRDNETYISGRDNDEKKITFFKVVPIYGKVSYEREYIITTTNYKEVRDFGGKTKYDSKMKTKIYYRVPNTAPPIFVYKRSK